MFPLSDPSGFHELISGRRRGAVAAMSRTLLRSLEIPYTWAVELRNWRYARGWASVHRVDVPVVSVGNITTGGTGKTPLVAWLADWFSRRQLRVALISRGYAAPADAAGQAAGNDEARELAQRLPEIPHLQNPDRVAAARLAVRQHDCQVIVLDDAFQHQRIARDLNIVLIDALQPFGFGHLLPRGLLREPLHRLARADLVALSRADAVDPPTRCRLRAEVLHVAPHAGWIEIAHQPRSLLNAAGHSRAAEQLQGLRVAAFAGIGNPDGFYHSLQNLGCRLVARRAFADHCPYDPDDLEQLQDWVARQGSIDAVVCTCKDLVKIDALRIADQPLWALVIDVQVQQGQETLEQRLTEIQTKIEQAAGTR